MRPVDLPLITIRDLSRSPGRVLDRVRRGERLIITRHGVPVATLQPLDGLVVQPFTGLDHDLTGTPLGGPWTEIHKLTTLQRQILCDCVRLDRILIGRLSMSSEKTRPALEDLMQRGLVRKEDRGLVLTGRGMVLHETLRAWVGAPRLNTWRAHRRRDARWGRHPDDP